MLEVFHCQSELLTARLHLSHSFLTHPSNLPLRYSATFCCCDLAEWNRKPVFTTRIQIWRNLAKPKTCFYNPHSNMEELLLPAPPVCVNSAHKMTIRIFWGCRIWIRLRVSSVRIRIILKRRTAEAQNWGAEAQNWGVEAQNGAVERP